MKQLSTLVFAVLSGYTRLALSADATYYGCYSHQGSLEVKADNAFQSRGACRVTCVDTPVAAGNPSYSVQAMTNETLCLCSQTLPNSIYKADDSDCKQPCPGYKTETCGTRLGTFFSVYLTGVEEGTPDEDPAPTSSSSSSTSSSTTEAQSSSTAPTSTAPVVSVTPTVSATPTPEKSVNKAGVAAGVVVGVLAVAGIGIGVFLLMKKRRREKVEEEYRKSAAAREFARKPEQDHRLDPVMIQRRDSVGSIADNQDYSRRILKVTNPDGN